MREGRKGSGRNQGRGRGQGPGRGQGRNQGQGRGRGRNQGQGQGQGQGQNRPGQRNFPSQNWRYQSTPELTERDFYTESQESKPARFFCPSCREENEYPVRWLRRIKKDKLPPGATAEDRERFHRARSYMVRLDEMLACRNLRCRKRFDIPTQQSVVLL